MTSLAAFIAANRFGLGPRPGDLARIDSDPKAWLLAQIDAKAPLPDGLHGLPPAAQTVKDVFQARLDGKDTLQEVREALHEQAFNEIEARIETQVRSDRPFYERLVSFWSNHFTVSATRFPVAVLAGPYEREAIRPYVFGRFEDMLVAVVRHPAMLIYLDNATSIGPDSKAGGRGKRGLNENLAREVLELHTLGVNGGYTQTDVTEFAKILTGWSHGGVRTRRAVQLIGPIHGEFEFLELAHEPGPKTLLGRTYNQGGEREGLAALHDIAHHPATAQHIATKLVRHFVADEPPADAVAIIAKRFHDTDGNLAEVSRALIDLQVVWAQPLAKVKQPDELVVSSLRALAVNTVKGRAMAGSMQELGQVMWNAPSPQGWPDTAADWISPESLMRRIEWSRALAARNGKRGKPDIVLAETIGPVASRTTRDAVSRAPAADDAVALILASPEFQRR